MTRVILVDDHALVRRGIRLTLEDHTEIEVVGEAGDYGELRTLLPNCQYDVIVMDINMPGKNGIDILKAMREEAPKCKVLILSMFTEDQYAVRSLRAGAYGYLNKASAPEMLIEAILKIAAGKKFITPEIAEAMANSLTADVDDHPHENLSDREFQTLRLIASGKKLSEVAEALAISPKTVSVYRARLLEKMGLSNNAELTHYALKNGLVD
ncbi:MAG: response regulator transcription factor [Rhodocyclaceae bacterium]|jgi:two-component system invasion response regulator UvrY|nr:response regulator transcription factor [Rhodocyclaceae bacterium]MCE2723956.1 response regulator transcription factor [Betaproteobacteria bacterium]MCA3017323.1 response regulator transcription factor [Rhodocyclaceae bacterium]MCA3020665.1 response regulator transcription factor [Rhodocyclaceae bacterium]MCA3026646.1 response regulator transcription factor [Rhodocyclaceae bacterium]